jgi:hypothetical protein
VRKGVGDPVGLGATAGVLVGGVESLAMSAVGVSARIAVAGIVAVGLALAGSVAADASLTEWVVFGEHAESAKNARKRNRASQTFDVTANSCENRAP